MPKTIIKKKTWRCVECDYAQSFKPTKKAMDFQFNKNPGISLSNVRAYECPSCVLQGKRDSQMRKETNPKKKTTTTVMGEEDIEIEIENVDGEDIPQRDFGMKVSTEAQKNAYREKRKKDIVDAIIATRKNEDKEE